MNRQEFLQQLKKEQAPKTDNKFTAQSFEGYSYLPENTSAEELLSRIDKSIDDKTGSSHRGGIRRQMPLLMRVAAAALLLLAAGIWYLNDPSAEASSDLFSQYYTPLAVAIPNEGINRGETQEYSYALSPVTEALNLYEQGDYQSANEVFASIPAEQKSEATNFYHSLSLLSIGEVATAIQLLEQLETSTEDIRYVENIRWYLALAYVKADQLAKAVPYLEMLQNSKHFQHKASNVLSKLQ